MVLIIDKDKIFFSNEMHFFISKSIKKLYRIRLASFMSKFGYGLSLGDGEADGAETGAVECMGMAQILIP